MSILYRFWRWLRWLHDSHDGVSAGWLRDNEYRSGCVGVEQSCSRWPWR